MTKTQQIFELYAQLTDVERELVKEKLAVEDDDYVETDEEMAFLLKRQADIKSGKEERIEVENLREFLREEAAQV